MTSQTAEDPLEEPPRKKLRKGTHSCFGCRRRKLRCIFPTPSATTCTECVARGIPCRSQEPGDDVKDNRKNVRQRLGELEGVVRGILERLDESGVGSPSSSGRQKKNQGSKKDVQTPPSVRSESVEEEVGAHENAPLQLLFDNAILSQHDALPANVDLGHHDMGLLQLESDKRRTELLAMLPDGRDLDLIFERGGVWWEMWIVFFPDLGKFHSPGDFARDALESGNIARVGGVLVALALSLQRLHPDFVTTHLHLSKSPEEIMDEYVTTVDNILAVDTKVANTMDGLETMALLSSFYINQGQPRRVWTNNRRMISIAMLLGFPRGVNTISTSPLDIRRRSIWFYLYWSDRYVSFLLGLPYSIHDSTSGIDFSALSPLVPEPWIQHLLELARLAGQLINRTQQQSYSQINQTNLQDLLGPTLQLDNDLDDLTSQLSKAPGNGTPLVSFWLRHIRAINHLPFMLASAVDQHRYDYSLYQCISAAREMLQLYPQLHPVPTAHLPSSSAHSVACKSIDFQAFTAAVLILLGLLGYGSRGGYPEHTSAQAWHQRRVVKRDWALIDGVIEILKTSSGVVAGQAVAVLELLRDIDRGVDPKARKAGRVVIPYFGTITLGPGRGFQRMRGAEPNDQMEFEGEGEHLESITVVPRGLSSQTTPSSLPLGPGEQTPHIAEWIMSMPSNNSPHLDTQSSNSTSITGIVDPENLLLDVSFSSSLFPNLEDTSTSPGLEMESIWPQAPGEFEGELGWAWIFENDVGMQSLGGSYPI